MLQEVSIHSLTLFIQVFFISTTRELLVNRIDLQAPTLVGPPRENPGSGTPSYTTPWQPTKNVILIPGVRSVQTSRVGSAEERISSHGSQCYQQNICRTFRSVNAEGISLCNRMGGECVNRTSSLPSLFSVCLWIRFGTSILNSPVHVLFPNKEAESMKSY